MSGSEPLEGEPHRLLGAGLADRAGDGDDRRVRAPPRRDAEAPHRVEHVRRDEERAGAGKLRRAVLGHHRCRGTLGERVADEAVAVMDVALDGEEQVARLKRAGVDRDAGRGA